MNQSTVVLCAINSAATLGLGINPCTGSLYPRPFQEDDLATEQTNVNTVSNHFLEVSDSSTFAQALTAAAGLSVGALTWSASASVEAMKQSCVATSSISYVAIVNVQTVKKELDLKSALLREDAKTLLSRDREKFFDTFGTHFIGGLIYGGTYFGSYSLITMTDDQKSAVQAELNASYGKGITVKGTASLSEAATKSAKIQKITIEEYYSGTKTQTGVDLAIIRKNYENFSSKFDNNKNFGDPIIAICYPISMVSGDIEASASQSPSVISELAKRCFEYEYYSGKSKELLSKGLYSNSDEQQFLESFPILIEPYIDSIKYMDTSRLRAQEAAAKADEEDQNVRQILERLRRIEQAKFYVKPKIQIDSTMTSPCFPDSIIITPNLKSIIVVGEFFKGWGAPTKEQEWAQRWVAGCEFGLVDSNGNRSDAGQLKMRAVLLAWGPRPGPGVAHDPPVARYKAGDFLPPNVWNEKFDGDWVGLGSNEPSIAQWTGAPNALDFSLFWAAP